MTDQQIGTRKRRTAEERRAEITQAAIALFARQGFERTTTREIAAAAGISEGTIYKYFATKQEILLSFLDSEIMSVVPVIFAVADGTNDAQVIRSFIADRFDVWERRRDLMRVVIGEAMFNPALAEGVRGKIQQALQGVEGFIDRRIADGAFRPVHPGIAARALIGQLLSVFLHWSLLMPHGNLPPRDQLIDELTALFMHGVLRQSTDEEEKVR